MGDRCRSLGEDVQYTRMLEVADDSPNDDFISRGHAAMLQDVSMCLLQAPDPEDVVRVKSCSSTAAGAWLRAIPANPSLRMSNAEMRGALCFRLHLPLAILLRGGDECMCHRNHDAKEKAKTAAGNGRRRSRKRKRDGHVNRSQGAYQYNLSRPDRVDAYGDHDVKCTSGAATVRHNRVQNAHFSDTSGSGAFVRRTNTLEMRTEAHPRSFQQGDLAVDLYGQQEDTAVLDFCVPHPTAATYSSKYCNSGDAAEYLDKKKNRKHGPRCDANGLKFIACAVETYGSMCGAFEKHLIELARMEEAKDGDLSFRPWYSRGFVQRAQQTIGVALQRSIYKDQIIRSHRRRAEHGLGAPSDGSSSDDY